MITHEQLKSERHSCRCAGRRGNNRALCRVCGGAGRVNGGDDMIGVLIAVSGVVAGWEAHKWFEHESLNRRYRKSVRIAARSYKRRRPRKVYTAGDDYA